MKSKWREFLNGKVQVKNKDKMNFEIRKRAKQMMEDLLLITEKMSPQQRIQIFTPEPKIFEAKLRDILVIPLARALLNNASVGYGQKEYEATAQLARGLIMANVPYDWVKLVENRVYREIRETRLKQLTQTKIFTETTEHNRA